MSSSAHGDDWQVAATQNPGPEGCARTPVWEMVVMASALPGSSVTPRNNRNELGDSEQKTTLSGGFQSRSCAWFGEQPGQEWS